ncbi:MAG TPA: SprT-like domain-containing protein [Fimbriimonas sp.]
MHDPALAPYAEALLAETMRAHPLPYQPRIVWKPYRVTAGMAYFKIGVIGLSVHVLRDEAMVRETLLHEYAHLLAVARHGRTAAGHGKEWRGAMRELGLDPVVRHRYEVCRNIPRQRVTYRCLRCAKSIQRLRRLPKGKRYVHAGCGGDLRLLRVERITADPADA